MKAPSTEDIAFLKEVFQAYPSAEWMLGGAMRFGQELIKLNKYFHNFFPYIEVKNMHATLPCLWSLDWMGQRPLVPDVTIINYLNYYQSAGTTITLCFDNPFIPEEYLNDSYSIGLAEVLHRNPRNRVWVADDKLRDLLRTKFPKLPIDAHPNRIYAERKKRGLDLYKSLCESYQRVAIHPKDARRKEIYEALSSVADRFIIITNDSCIATCPLRYNHLQQLAKRRIHPYESDARLAISDYMVRMQCQDLGHITKKQLGNVNHQQLRTLHDLGYKHFAVLEEKARNVVSICNDFFYYSFSQALEHERYRATLLASLYYLLQEASNPISGGLKNIAQNPDPSLIAI